MSERSQSVFIRANLQFARELRRGGGLVVGSLGASNPSGLPAAYANYIRHKPAGNRLNKEQTCQRKSE
ncbi:hypothetical protein [Pseudomonas sp. Irchel s3h17]|uniref:hypothetical protein n=1 Tax=Pseudomonas sp. Irchel s3h17 TaxID=2009182 RepID=UPI00117A3344|nr:hypothetical protein [Pseudomonas sp. Irchel s3h17]